MANGHRGSRSLRIAALAVGAAMLLGACAASVPATRVVYVVRHAEKASEADDAALSAAGHARAGHLAERLRDAGIVAILTSDRRRTRDTAGPLAARLGIRPGVVPYGDDARGEIAAIANWIAAQPPGALLVVTHSDRLPCVVHALTGARVPALAHDEFDRLIRVEAGRLAEERYGAAFDGVAPAQPGCDLAVPVSGTGF